jgi:hypothetical protein
MWSVMPSWLGRRVPYQSDCWGAVTLVTPYVIQITNREECLCSRADRTGLRLAQSTQSIYFR